MSMAVPVAGAVDRVAGYCLLAAWQIGFGRTRAPVDGSEVAAPRGWPMTVAGPTEISSPSSTREVM